MEAGVFPLSLDVLVAIQSRMNPKEAARSSNLCKRLYRTWYANENVELDQRLFSHPAIFWDNAAQTMFRYMKYKLNIGRLSLHILSGRECYHLARKILSCASKLGAKEIEIRFNSHMMFSIPDDVFGSDGLRRLIRYGGIFAFPIDFEVSSPNLESLNFHPFAPASDMAGFVSGFILNCEKLNHLDCEGFMLTPDFDLIGDRCHNLENLRLVGLKGSRSPYFKNIFRLFPRLKNLTLVGIYCCDCEPIRICNDSIESIRIVNRQKSVVLQLNVPNLRLFQFEGIAASRFDFESHKSDWVCDINVFCFVIKLSWFASFRNLLKCFAFSKLNVSIRTECVESERFIFRVHSGAVVPVAVLSLRTPLPNPTLLDNLLRICHPELVRINGDPL